jgi:hypothetical protein
VVCSLGIEAKRDDPSVLESSTVEGESPVGCHVSQILAHSESRVA